MASGNFGPTSTGYNRPTLAELIQQEQNAMLVGIPGLTFAAGSPELAIAESRAKLRNDDWEAAECSFNSFDLNNQSGCALDVAAGLQGFIRLPNETDAEFLARINATVSGNGFVTDLEAALSQVADLCRVTVFNNTTDSLDPFTGNPPHSFEVVYQGGDAQDVALQTWICSTGATNIGTDTVTFTDADGICRRVNITPVTEVPYCVRLFVDTYELGACSNQTFENIQSATLEALQSKSLRIGGPIFAGLISSTVFSQVSGLDITSIQFAPSSVDANGNCTCANVEESDWVDGPLQIGHRSIPTFDFDCIEIIARDR